MLGLHQQIGQALEQVGALRHRGQLTRPQGADQLVDGAFATGRAPVPAAPGRRAAAPGPPGEVRAAGPPDAKAAPWRRARAGGSGMLADASPTCSAAMPAAAKARVARVSSSSRAVSRWSVPATGLRCCTARSRARATMRASSGEMSNGSPLKRWVSCPGVEAIPHVPQPRLQAAAQLEEVDPEVGTQQAPGQAVALLQQGGGQVVGRDGAVPAVAGDDGGQVDRPYRLGREAVGAPAQTSDVRSRSDSASHTYHSRMSVVGERTQYLNLEQIERVCGGVAERLLVGNDRWSHALRRELVSISANGLRSSALGQGLFGPHLLRPGRDLPRRPRGRGQDLLRRAGRPRDVYGERFGDHLIGVNCQSYFAGRFPPLPRTKLESGPLAVVVLDGVEVLPRAARRWPRSGPTPSATAGPPSPPPGTAGRSCSRS